MDLIFRHDVRSGLALLTGFLTGFIFLTQDRPLASLILILVGVALASQKFTGRGHTALLVLGSMYAGAVWATGPVLPLVAGLGAYLAARIVLTLVRERHAGRSPVQATA